MIPTDLTVNDVGFLLAVVDYNHVLRWTGTAWEFAPGDGGNGFFRDFAIAPQEAGWLACNGQEATYLKIGTSLVAARVRLPDEATTPAYHKAAAAYDPQVHAAVPAVIAGATASEAAHTHPVTVPDWDITVTPVTETVQSGGGADVADDTAITAVLHGLTMPTGVGTPHGHGSGTLANDTTGEPAHVNVRRYFRT